FNRVTVNIAYTNMPYVPDVGARCGANFVNAGPEGALDGISIVNGHEYSETITDRFPASGWIDGFGAENADKCAWISSGQGAAATLSTRRGCPRPPKEGRVRRISVFGVGAVVAVLALGAPALAVGQSPHKGAPIVHGRFGKVPFVGRRPVGRAANSLRFGGG